MTQLNFSQLPDTLKHVNVRPLMVLKFDVKGPIALGNTPSCNRNVGLITGGRFDGDRLRGKVIEGGSDWQTIRKDGSWTMDVRVILETDDGALIGMFYEGIRTGRPEVLARLPKGHVDPSEYYFRTTPRFETSDSRYDWMNRIVTVGIGHRFPEGPLYSLFEVC